MTAKFNMPKVPKGLGEYAARMSTILQEKDALIKELTTALETMVDEQCYHCGKNAGHECKLECCVLGYKELVDKAKTETHNKKAEQ